MKKLLFMWIMLLGMGGVIFADETTSYEPDVEKTSIATGDIFAIYNKTDDKYLYGSGAQNLGYGNAVNTFSSSNSGWLFKAESVTVNDEEYFLLRLITPNLEEYSPWPGADGYLNTTTWCSFILGLNNQNGQDHENGAVWDIQYNSTEGGFSIKNIFSGLYLNDGGAANKQTPVYWTLCTLKETTIENPIPKPTRTATDAKIISLNDFAGETWNAEEKTFTGTAGFKWEEGLDLSEYQYLIVTAAKNMSKGGYSVSIKDKNGKKITGDEYGIDFMNLWFGQWNNHNCLNIDLEKLRVEQQFDIYNITDLTINGEDGFILSNVYATNQKPTNEKAWDGEDNGDFKIENLPADKFGTICLPWQAAVAGAFVYEISEASGNYISLTRVEGLMEAGKPYIYKTNGNNAGKETNNIYFYKATAATVATPIANNGLIGTFTATTAPQGENIYVLSGNKLYDTVGSTVNVGANKAYIDMSQIVNQSSEAKNRIFIDFGNAEATGIKSVNDIEALNSGKMYDLSGREVTNPTSGIYIMGGKKIIIK